MEKYGIKTYGSAVLRKKAGRVKEVDEGIRKLAAVMEKVMVEAKGLGLAAPQIGVEKRVIVFDGGKGNLCLVNPKVMWKKGRLVLNEGCLSFPGIGLEIKRAKEIGVKAVDLGGREVRFVACGVRACIIQHEIDHLDGILIIDRVRRKELKTIESRLKEIEKNSSDKNDKA